MTVASAAMDLDARLNEVARQYDDLQAELAQPETATDPDSIRRLDSVTACRMVPP